MPGIGGPSRIVNVRPPAPSFLALLRSIVAWLAKRLQRAKEELVGVTIVRLEVIGDGCRHGHATSETERTEGMRRKLSLATPDPVSGGVQGMPAGRDLRHQVGACPTRKAGRVRPGRRFRGGLCPRTWPGRCA